LVDGRLGKKLRLLSYSRRKVRWVIVTEIMIMWCYNFQASCHVLSSFALICHHFPPPPMSFPILSFFFSFTFFFFYLEYLNSAIFQKKLLRFWISSSGNKMDFQFCTFNTFLETLKTLIVEQNILTSMFTGNED